MIFKKKLYPSGSSFFEFVTLVYRREEKDERCSLLHKKVFKEQSLHQLIYIIDLNFVWHEINCISDDGHY